MTYEFNQYILNHVFLLLENGVLRFILMSWIHVFYIPKTHIYESTESFIGYSQLMFPSSMVLKASES